MERADVQEIWVRERQQRLLAHDLDYLALAQHRWTMTFGDAASAVAPLTRELEAARIGLRGRRSIKLLVLRAMALHASGQLDAALDDTEQVLRTSAQEGYVRILLDEGPSVGAMIRRFARVRGSAPNGLDPVVADHIDCLLRGIGPAPAAVDEAANTPSAEALTAKEQRVLELLGEGYSNNAMAEKLFLSESTVRTHLRAISLKLSATNRTHAIAIARKRGLIQ
jgi:LuxR family maltose regulon positive regulatory protein